MIFSPLAPLIRKTSNNSKESNQIHKTIKKKRISEENLERNVEKHLIINSFRIIKRVSCNFLLFFLMCLKHGVKFVKNSTVNKLKLTLKHETHLIPQ